MTTKEVNQRANESEATMRARELEVFETFIDRALSIVRQEEKESIADACRLVETALKASRGDGSAALSAGADNGVQSLIDELHTGYKSLRAQAAVNPTKGKAGL